MATPYGLRLRQRIIELYDQDKSTAEIAAALGTSASGTRRVRQHLRERGTVEPLPAKGGGRGPDEAQLRRLAELVEQQPDATLAELRERLRGADRSGPLVSVATVDRWCRRLGLRYKKNRIGRLSRTATT
jgi:transposase